MKTSLKTNTRHHSTHGSLSSKVYLRLACIIGIAITLLIGSTALAEDLKQAAILSNTCTGCHSLEGNFISIGPNISRYKATELEAILKEFRDGTRPSTMLSRQAKLYTDAEISLIANYIGGQ